LKRLGKRLRKKKKTIMVIPSLVVPSLITVENLADKSFLLLSLNKGT
jgi:hypothetical protein